MFSLFQSHSSCVLQKEMIILSKILNGRVKSKLRLKKVPSSPKRLHFSGKCFSNYQRNNEAFDSLCRALGFPDIIKPLITLQATPGLGKSAFLDKLASDIFNWKHFNEVPPWASTAPLWLHDSIVIPVTFNHDSLSQLHSKYRYFSIYKRLFTS